MSNVLPFTPKAPFKTRDLPFGATLVLGRRQGPDWEVLTVTRRHGTTLCMPGGKRDPLESAAENAVRETFEETGIQVPLMAIRPLYEGLCPFLHQADYRVTAFWALWDDRWGVPETQEAGIVPSWMPLEGYLARAEFADFDQRALGCLSLPRIAPAP